jgi:diacylglycerol kinase (ATP)
VAIIPVGTANNIARAFGVTGAPHELAETWRLDRYRRLNVGLATGPWGRQRFVEGVGIGMLAAAMEKPFAKLSGAVKLLAAREDLRKKLRKAKPINVKFGIDGESLRTKEVFGIEIVNIAYVGPALALPSAADAGKGKLSLIVIGERERDAILSWIDAPRGRLIPLRTRPARKIEFSWKNTPVRLDGEVMDVPDGRQSATAQVDGSTVKVLVSSTRIE